VARFLNPEWGCISKPRVAQRALGKARRQSRQAIGLEFTCLWDEEHGLGALISRGKVRELGGVDVSFVDM
jgi:hypothetical protein